MLIINIRMDTQKALKQADREKLEKLSGRKVVVGTKQLRKALEKGLAQYVCLAKNADPAITEPIEEACLRNHVEYAWISTMLDLGNACGIEVGAAAAAAVK